MRSPTARLVLAAIATSVVALLAACGTVPAKEAPASRSAPAGGVRPTLVPASPPPSIFSITSGGPGAPGEPGVTPSSNLPPDDAPSALLGGEVPREFQRGTASWYGPGFQGRRTASGERYNMREFTAAHRTLPFGTLVRVHSLVNGREVDVRITDRGPYSGDRIIDVSRAAAEELGMLGLGFKQVMLLVPDSTPAVEIAPPPPPKRRLVRRPAPKKR